MNSELQVKSEYGKGTVFFFVLDVNFQRKDENGEINLLNMEGTDPNSFCNFSPFRDSDDVFDRDTIRELPEFKNP